MRDSAAVLVCVLLCCVWAGADEVAWAGSQSGAVRLSASSDQALEVSPEEADTTQGGALAPVEETQGLRAWLARISDAVRAKLKRVWARDPFAHLEGHVVDSTYVSWDGRVTVQLMYETSEGLEITEEREGTYGAIHFENDFGGLTRIEYHEGLRQRAENEGLLEDRSFLECFSGMLEFFVRDDYTPQAELLERDFFNVCDRPCGFLAMYVPRGSSLVEQPTGVHPDATLAFLFFEGNERTYIIRQIPRIEASFRQVTGPADEEAKHVFVPDLREGLTRLVQEGQFE